MRPEEVTYNVFHETIQKMIEQGEKISVRTIASHTGGSFSKIAIFLKQWREEQAHAQSLKNHELSSHLKQALLAEISKAVKEKEDALKTQLAQTSEQLDEINETLAKQEKLITDYEQQINQLKQRVAVMTELEQKQQQENSDLEEKLEDTIKALHEAEKRAAVAEAHYSEIKRHNDDINLSLARRVFGDENPHRNTPPSPPQEPGAK